MTQFVRETNTYVGKVKLTIILTQRHLETVKKPVNGEKYQSLLPEHVLMEYFQWRRNLFELYGVHHNSSCEEMNIKIFFVFVFIL